MCQVLEAYVFQFSLCVYRRTFGPCTMDLVQFQPFPRAEDEPRLIENKHCKTVISNIFRRLWCQDSRSELAVQPLDHVFCTDSTACGDLCVLRGGSEVDFTMKTRRNGASTEVFWFVSFQSVSLHVECVSEAERVYFGLSKTGRYSLMRFSCCSRRIQDTLKASVTSSSEDHSHKQCCLRIRKETKSILREWKEDRKLQRLQRHSLAIKSKPPKPTPELKYWLRHIL